MTLRSISQTARERMELERSLREMEGRFWPHVEHTTREIEKLWARLGETARIPHEGKVK